MNTHKTQTVAAIAGVTYRQLDHWASRGYLRPDYEHHEGGRGKGSGYARLWDEAETAVAVRMALLVRIGYRVEVAAQIARGTP